MWCPLSSKLCYYYMPTQLPERFPLDVLLFPSQILGAIR